MTGMTYENILLEKKNAVCPTHRALCDERDLPMNCYSEGNRRPTPTHSQKTRMCVAPADVMTGELQIPRFARDDKS